MIADISLRRRIEALEADLAATRREMLSDSRRARAWTWPRDTWLGRTWSDSPGSYPESGDTFAVKLLSAHYAATAGEQAVTEQERGSAVVARTWPAVYVPRNTPVIVHRLRGLGAAGSGEYWMQVAEATPRQSAALTSRSTQEFVSVGSDGSYTDNAFTAPSIWPLRYHATDAAFFTPNPNNGFYDGGLTHGTPLFRLNSTGLHEVSLNLQLTANAMDAQGANPYYEMLDELWDPYRVPTQALGVYVTIHMPNGRQQVVEARVWLEDDDSTCYYFDYARITTQFWRNVLGNTSSQFYGYDGVYQVPDDSEPGDTSGNNNLHGSVVFDQTAAAGRSYRLRCFARPYPVTHQPVTVGSECLLLCERLGTVAAIDDNILAAS